MSVTQNQHPAPPPGPAPFAPPQRKGLAVAALVLGIVAIAGCIVPLLNIGSIVLALVGLGLGIPALVLAKRPTHGGAGLAIAGVVLSVLAVIGAVVVNVVAAAAITGASQAVDQAVQDAETGSSQTDPDEAAAAALSIGQQATVGEYTVTVTGVNQDADALIAGANSFNEPPTGKYVVADLSVVYNGADEGDPWIDLAEDYQGTDARDYSTMTCSAVVPNSSIEQPTLRTGGAAQYSVCFDLPADAIAGGRVAVSESLSLRDGTAYWKAA